MALAALPAVAFQVIVPGGASSRPQARASAEALLETMTVIRPLNGSPASDYERTSATDLDAGSTYRIVVTGSVSTTGGVPNNQIIDVDALYCFRNVNTPPSFGSCTPPRRGTPLRFAIGGGAPAELDKLPGYRGPLLDYSAVHRYEVELPAPASGALHVSQLAGLVDSTTGAWIVQIYGPATGAGGSPTGGAAAPGDVAIFAPAKGWGKPIDGGVLQPGGTAALQSPKLAPGQTKASVTIQTAGDGAGKIVTHVPLRGRGAAKLCFYAYQGGATLKEQFIRQGSIPQDVLDRSKGKELFDEEKDPTLRTLGFLACLEAVRQADPGANSRGPAPSAAAAARARCRTSAPRLKLLVDRPSGTVLYRVRRPSRRGGAGRLRVSCRATRDGLSVRVRTRSRRIKLRSVVGSRLRLGVHRSRAATGAGTLRATFRR